MSTIANPSSRSKKHLIKSGSKSVADIESTSMQDENTHNESIAVRAYFCAQKRGFEPGHELDDWLTAEQAECHGH